MVSILADPGQSQCKRPQTRPSLRPAETASCRGRAAYKWIGPERQEMQRKISLAVIPGRREAANPERLHHGRRILRHRAGSGLLPGLERGNARFERLVLLAGEPDRLLDRLEFLAPHHVEIAQD